MYQLIIVDDEEELREGLSSCFPWQAHGFVVAGTFGDCRSAVAFCLEHPVDVVLSDIRMPFQSGFDLIQTLKDQGKNPLFCIMSAYSEFTYAQQALRLGVEDYLVKPASFDDIAATMEKIRAKLDGTPAETSKETGTSVDNPLISKAIALIHRKTGTCTLQSVAGELSISQSYLSRLFKETMGKTFQNYLLQTRMQQAADMLKSGQKYTNKDIATTLGYQDTQNFCRTFRRYWNTTPQQFKKRAIHSGK
ncbi:MAG: response regulator [Sphaerochaetaceae bacterium]|jgi:YesN/AraC family two-component response regulator|nr:response regulator [Sphaerochaetaceae bacterium]